MQINPADELVRVVADCCARPDGDWSANLAFFNANRPPEHLLTAADKRAIKTAITGVLDRDEMWPRAFGPCIFLASVLFAYGDKKSGADYLVKAFDHCADPALRGQLYMLLKHQCFANNVDMGFALDDLFFRHYEDWFGRFPKPALTARPGRCIVLTPQVLAAPHAPTVDALAKCAILRDAFGFEVVLVNSHEIPAHCNLPVLDRPLGARRPDLRGLQTMEHPDYGAIRVFTPPGEMPSHAGYLALIEFVAQWQPEFILSYGAGTYASEYLGQSVKVIAMPAGTELLPTRTAAFDVCFHPFGDRDRAMIARYGMEKVGIIETLYNYDMPARSRSYARADFQLTDDDFAIAMVGTRLSDELDDGNLALIGEILALDPAIKIVLAGPLTDAFAAKIAGRLPLDRLRLPGRVADIPAFYDSVADLYVNPRRTGGGTSAAYALGCGIPCFTLAFGHVANLTHPDFVFDTPAALLAAIRAALPPAARTSLRATALAGFARIGSRERMVRDILTNAGIARAARQDMC